MVEKTKWGTFIGNAEELANFKREMARRENPVNNTSDAVEAANEPKKQVKTTVRKNVKK